MHEIGAKHLADPTKLLRSASRLYGERMAELHPSALSAVDAVRLERGRDDEVESGG